jgi:hypothetical protein
MVGFTRKIKQVLNMIKQYSPFLSKLYPGLGEVVGTAAGLGEGLTDGFERVYDDYSSSKKGGKKYGLMDGIKSFVSKSKNNYAQKGAMQNLTSDYGGVHPRLMLTSGGPTVEEIDE